jgi:dienelactone hydrolase
MVMMREADLGLLAVGIVAAMYTSAGALAGVAIYWIVRSRRQRLLHVMIVCLVLVIGWAGLAWPWPWERQPIQHSADAGQPVVKPLLGESPGTHGAYAYNHFTYGSGLDRHRKEFGSEADLLSESVDASAYITKWRKLRTRFWGFDQSSLPVNGRVWMPEGEGKFPLVLMVHGNHLMEDFSDEGYGYLGELLASRGFIAVSVDENFLNYSVWSNIPDHDMKMRAWMLLKHLQQIQHYDGAAGNPFNGKVDWQRVGLIGHSRGGQAVAIAADRQRWFAQDKTLSGLEQLRIEAVVSIAPTDWTVDKKSVSLWNVNYLTLQGARDGDLHNFYGEEQYARTAFSSHAGRFKASVYLPAANHSQFNTSWGAYDLSYPGGLLLHLGGMLEGSEQRQAAKVYIAAFLEDALRGDQSYRSLFVDYRAGRNWLPDTEVIGRYEDDSIAIVSRYEQPGIRSLNVGVTAEVLGMKEWGHVEALNRDRKDKGTDGLSLRWDGSASYRIAFDGRFWESKASAGATALAFSATDLRRDLLRDKEIESLPDDYAIEIEIEGGGGQVVKLPLEAFDSLRKLPAVTFTIHPFLERRYEKGKFKDAVEPVFQTFYVPLEAFTAVNPDLLQGGIRSVTFRFGAGPGKLMIDDIGFYAGRL